MVWNEVLIREDRMSRQIVEAQGKSKENLYGWLRGYSKKKWDGNN